MATKSEILNENYHSLGFRDIRKGVGNKEVEIIEFRVYMCQEYMTFT